MAYEFPGSRSIRAGVEVDSRSVVAPAISSTQNGSSGVATHWLRQLRQRRLSAETPPVDRVVQIRYMFPRGATIFRLEDREVVWVVAGEGGGGDDGSVLEFGVAGVGD